MELCAHSAVRPDGGENLFAGVEIGGTKQQIAVGTAQGTILRRWSVQLGCRTTAREILAWIGTTLKQICTEYTLTGVGVGFGGPVDPAAGTVLCSLQVDGWKGFGLKDWFERTLSLPAWVLNDTAAGGLAEWRLGAGRGSRRLFYTNIGTGIGGGLYTEKSFGASSLGYVWVPDWQDTRPNTATRLEFLCSGQHTEERLNAPGYVPRTSVLAEKAGRITCADLGRGVLDGDAFCAEELDRVARTFSLGLADVLALASPDRIVIGGGVAKMGEILFSRLRAYTREHAFVADVGQYEILASELMDDAVLAGALLYGGNPDLLTVWGRSCRY